MLILLVYLTSLQEYRYIFILGRKGIEPLTALAIEFTVQPVIPTNGTFLNKNILL